MSERSELFSLPDFHLLAPATLKRTSRLARCASPGDGECASFSGLFCFVVPTEVGTRRREGGWL